MDKFPFKRHCPKCNREIFYSRKDSLKRAETQNRLCSSCTISGENNPFYGKHHTDISNKKNAEWHKGRKTSDIHKLNTSRNHSKYWLGKKRDLQTRQKVSIGLKGKTPTNETRYKLRLSAIKRIEKQGIVRAFNPKACIFIDKLNQEKGWNLQHAENGGEVELYGYFVDGYDRERNIIFEYDESHHYDIRGNLKTEDVKRQKNLLEKINPSKFFRYDEMNKKLYDCKVQTTIPILI